MPWFLSFLAIFVVCSVVSLALAARGYTVPSTLRMLLVVGACLTLLMLVAAFLIIIVTCAACIPRYHWSFWALFFGLAALANWVLFRFGYGYNSAEDKFVNFGATPSVMNHLARVEREYMHEMEQRERNGL